MQVILHGILAERFPHLNNRDWHCDSIAKAVNLINANSDDNGFYRAIKPLKLHAYDADGDRYYGESNLDWSLTVKTIHLMPAVEGSGRTAMVIAGTILLVVAAAAMIIASGGLATPVAWGAFTAGEVALVGVSLVVGAMLMPAGADYDSRDPTRRSVLYQGGANRIAEGAPVALILGRKVRQGGAIISTGMDILQEQYDPGAV